jgi:hypothetical protein
MEQTPEANFISGDSHAPQESKFIFLDWLTEIQVVVGILLLVFTPVLLYVIMQAHWCISGSICGLHRRRENYSIEAILIAAKRSDKTPLEEKRIEETRDHMLVFAICLYVRPGVWHYEAFHGFCCVASAAWGFCSVGVFTLSELRELGIAGSGKKEEGQLGPCVDLYGSPCWEHVRMHVHVCDSNHALWISSYVRLLPREARP